MYSFDQILPTDAVHGDNIESLLETLIKLSPISPHIYEEDALTDKSTRFLVAEILREKLMRNLGDELPYAVSVVIDKFEEQAGIDYIDATIWIERSGSERHRHRQARRSLEEYRKRRAAGHGKPHR